MGEIVVTSQFPQPRERVYDWLLRPGSHERLSAPG